jgi:hypothetical protein
MAFCRKIFATCLRNNGIGQEVIDLSLNSRKAILHCYV